MAVSVKLCAKIDQRVRSLARRLNCSHHFIMVEAIRRFVECEEQRLDETSPDTGMEATLAGNRGPAGG